MDPVSWRRARSSSTGDPAEVAEPGCRSGSSRFRCSQCAGCAKRANRPLLQTGRSRVTLRTLIEERYPIYAPDMKWSCATARTIGGSRTCSCDRTHLANGSTRRRLGRRAGLGPGPLMTGEASHRAAKDAMTVRVDLGPRSLRHPDRRPDRRGGQPHRRARSRCACAIVTDANVAGHHLAALQDSLARPASAMPRLSSLRRSVEILWRFHDLCDACWPRAWKRRLVVALGAGSLGDLAALRRPASARHALRPDADSLWPRSILGRRQDRHQFSPWEESGRRVPPAGPGPRRQRLPRHAAQASSRPAMPKWSNTD